MKCTGLLCVVLLTTLTLGLAQRKSYEGYQEWEVYVGHRLQAAVLDHLEATSQVDILLAPQPGRRGVVLVPPTVIRSTQTSLQTAGIRTRVLTTDFQTKIAEQYASIDARYETDPYAFDLNKYNTFDALMTQMGKWEADCPTGMECVLQSIGDSYEGRPMKMLKLKKAGSSNQVLYFEFTIHAREWLSTSTGQNLINKIIYNYPSDAETKHLVDNYEIHILLVANPDGYIHTFQDPDLAGVEKNTNIPDLADVWKTQHPGLSDRLWRKSRNNNTGSICKGTDLNRNFDALWSKQGASSIPCLPTFCGSGAASEPEVRNMQAHIDTLKNRAVATYAVHCCAKMWMFPYGYTKDFKIWTSCQRTVDHDDLQKAANAGVDAVQKESGVLWKAGTICEVIYPVTGSTSGYSYSKASIKYSWAIEVAGWFTSPESKIEPVFTQFWAALVASTNEIENIEGQ